MTKYHVEFTKKPKWKLQMLKIIILLKFQCIKIHKNYIASFYIYLKMPKVK